MHFFQKINIKKLSLVSFLQSLILSFLVIIIVCTMIMGSLSYNIMNRFISDRTLAYNNKMLEQFKNNVDSMVISNINDTVMSIIYDINVNYFLRKYIKEEIQNNISEITLIGRYLNSKITLQPMIYSIAIFYSQNNLLVSTEYVRHTLYRTIDSQPDLLHFTQIIDEATYNGNDNVSFVFDYGSNYHYKLPEYLGKKIPNTLIHAIKPIYGSNRVLDGAIIVSVSSEVFSSAFKKYAPKNLGDILIVNQNGLIISHNNNTFTGRSIYEYDFGNKLMSNNNFPFIISKVNNTNSIISYQPSGNNNWKYVSISPLEDVSSAAAYISKVVSITTLLSILIALLISVSLAKRLAKPLVSIANLCREKIQSPNRRNEFLVIRETLNNMEEILESREDDFKEILPILKVSFLESIFSETPPTEEEISTKIKTLYINFPHKNFCAVLLKINNKNSEDLFEKEYNKITITKLFENAFSTDFSTCLFFQKDNIIFAIINFDLEWVKLIDKAKELMTIILENIPQNKYLAFGSVYTDINHMHLSYKEAYNALNYSFIYPERIVFTPDDIVDTKISHPDIILLKNFSNSLMLNNTEEIEKIISCLINTTRSEFYSYDQVIKILTSYISVVKDFIITHNNQKNIDLDMEFLKIEDILEFETWILKIIDESIENYTVINESNPKLVKQIQEYIEQNIRNSQLSLEFIATKLDKNPKYLSRVFKAETGYKFTDYVTNMKMQYCKNLLITTNLSIDQISSIMGFSSPQYFITRFKLVFGCTTKEYRLKNLNKSVLDP